MKSFTLNGVTYKNGFMCNDAGQPITMKNGYSSEDEKEARQEFYSALQILEEKQKQAPKPKRYTKKLLLTDTLSPEELAKQEKEWYEGRQLKKDGYLLNDAGEKISVENGYTDIDEKLTKKQLKNMIF